MQTVSSSTDAGWDIEMISYFEQEHPGREDHSFSPEKLELLRAFMDIIRVIQRTNGIRIIPLPDR